MQQDLLQLRESKSLVQMRRRERHLQAVRRGAAWLAGVAVAMGFVALADRVVWRRGAPQPSQRSLQAPAHPSYTLGRNYLDQFLSGLDLQRAAQAFECSTQAEPGFAPAYGCLAYAHIWAHDFWNPWWKDLPEAQQYASEGLKRGDSAEAHLALAWCYAVGEWRWQEAQREYETAFALQPSSALCHFSYGEFLRLIGYAEEGLKELKVAMSIEPHPKFLDVRWPAFLVDAKHYDEALAAIEKSRGSIPSDWSQNAERNAFCALGRFADAIEMDREFCLSKGRLEDDVAQEFAPLKRAFAAEGAKGYWRAGIKMTQGFEQTCCYAQAGEKEKALTQLKAALQRRDRQSLFHVMTDWRLDDLRSDPAFKDLLKEMNLPRPMAQGRLPSPLK